MNSKTNLPPGVLASDLDPKMVPCRRCKGRGHLNTYTEDGDWVGKCDCPTCDGQGEVHADSVTEE